MVEMTLRQFRNICWAVGGTFWTRYARGDGKGLHKGFDHRWSKENHLLSEWHKWGNKGASPTVSYWGANQKWPKCFWHFCWNPQIRASIWTLGREADKLTFLILVNNYKSWWFIIQRFWVVLGMYSNMMLLKFDMNVNPIELYMWDSGFQSLILYMYLTVCFPVC